MHRKRRVRAAASGDRITLTAPPGASISDTTDGSDPATNGVPYAGAIVLPRLSIGDNTVIGAGSVVTRDVPPNFIVVGNPARVLHVTLTDEKPL